MSKTNRERADARQDDRNIQWRNGIAYGRIEVNGKERRRSLRTKDPAQARRRLKEWKDEVMAEAGLAEPKHSWMEAVGRYLLEVGPGTVKPDVLKRYECSLAQVHPWLGHLRVDQITRRTIADMVGGRKRKGVTNATVNRDLTAVSRVLAAAVMWDWRDGNPARDFDRRSMTRERRDPIKRPKDEHVDAMIAASPPMFAALLKVLRTTGLRAEECSTLEWYQVGLNGNRTAIDLVRTKTDRPRSIPLDGILTTEAAKVLKDLLPPQEAGRPGGAEAGFRLLARRRGGLWLGVVQFRLNPPAAEREAQKGGQGPDHLPAPRPASPVRDHLSGAGREHLPPPEDPRPHVDQDD